MKTRYQSSEESFKRYAMRSVPRYTSYPTANHFGAFSGSQKADLLKSLSADHPISVYIHIPFCDRLCWFCGCHTKQTNRYGPVADYVAALVEEIALTKELLSDKPDIAYLHLGGGSPSLLREKEMSKLREALEDCFCFSKATEVSVELDPKDAHADLENALRAIGITRASLGVQDFSEDVQRAINRQQSYEDTARMRDVARRAGAQAFNIDVLYGLPHQTVTKCCRTMLRVVDLNPDRVALFGYAHVPWMKKHQNMIEEKSLPDSEERYQQMLVAEAMFETAGYRKIGLDHFAKPGDTLAIAADHGCLHRNFQGYTTDHCKTLIGFGASSISYLKRGYVQNTVPTGRYMADVGAGQLSASRGVFLTRDDHIRRYIIERLMCDFAVDFSKLGHEFGSDDEIYRQLAQTVPDALALWGGERLSIRPEARHLTRIVASFFDKRFNRENNSHSLAV